MLSKAGLSERERQTVTEKPRSREREREGERGRDRDTERETERDRDRETDRHREREGDRDRDRSSYDKGMRRWSNDPEKRQPWRVSAPGSPDAQPSVASVTTDRSALAPLPHRIVAHTLWIGP